MPIHGAGAAFSSVAAAHAAIDAFALAPLVTPVVSAHVMGGCPLGPDPRARWSTRPGRHHHLANLHVLDGSLFPTSIGANPQLSIYGLVARLATDARDGAFAPHEGRWERAVAPPAAIRVFALTRGDTVDVDRRSNAIPSIPEGNLMQKQ